jgi:hypothetical protein
VDRVYNSEDFVAVHGTGVCCPVFW